MGHTVQAKLTTKNQITVPASVRERLWLREGDVLEFEFAEDGRIVVRQKPAPDPLGAFLGIEPRTSRERILADLRDARGHRE
jgi:AbrB family looped-hinge helix DNA binding protein